MYLRIDLGTYAVKACVLSPEGGIVETRSATLSMTHPFEGASEQACAEWWAATGTAVGALSPGARPIAWLAGILGRPIPDLLAEAEHARSGPIFLPYLTGERTPHGDSNIRGGFAGLSETATHGSLMRAVVEAVAFTFADAAEAVAATGAVPDELLAIGGGSRSDLLLQMIADITGLRLGRSSSAHAGSAVGATRLAMAAGTVAQSAAEFPKAEVEVRFEPSTPSAPNMSARLEAYRARYPALKSSSL